MHLINWRTSTDAEAVETLLLSRLQHIASKIRHDKVSQARSMLICDKARVSPSRLFISCSGLGRKPPTFHSKNISLWASTLLWHEMLAYLGSTKGRHRTAELLSVKAT